MSDFNLKEIIHLIQEANKSDIKISFLNNELVVKIRNTKKIDEAFLERIKKNKHNLIDYFKKYKNVKNSLSEFYLLNGTRPERVPLSFSQERLWFIDQLRGSIQYHIPIVLRLKGVFDRNAFVYALKMILKRHEILRTIITSHDGKPFQSVQDYENWDLGFVNLMDHRESKTDADEQISFLSNRPFDLSKDYMLRGDVIKVKEDEHILILTIHHIASDAWSMSVLVKELVEIYNSRIKGMDYLLPDLNLQYSDYSIWQRNYLSGEYLSHRLAYWEEKLEGVAPLNLPLDYKRPNVQSSNGAALTFVLNQELNASLDVLSQQCGATMFMTMLAAFKLLLYRYTSQNDICIGSAVAGRDQHETTGLIGFFTNTLALRSNLNKEMSFKDLLIQLRKTCLDAYDHQDVPFEKIVESVVKGRDMSRSPLVQVMFDLQKKQNGKTEKLKDLVILPQNSSNLTSKFELSLSVQQSSEGILGVFEYCTDLFEAETISQLANQYETLLKSISSDPDKLLDDLNMLSASERDELVLGFNGTTVDYPRDKTVVDLFRDTVSAYPERTALVFGEVSMSYSELDERSNRVGHYLRSLGVREDSLVSLCVERGLDMIVGMLGILKSGGAYVPLDPSYPQDRLEYMLSDTGSSVVLCGSSISGLFGSGCSARVVELDGDWAEISGFPSGPVDTALLPSNLAYVIYTSGSTGKPKGVMVEHRNLMNYLVNGKTAYLTEDKTSTGTFLHLSYTFDASLTSIFMPLIKGKKMVIGTGHPTEIFKGKSFREHIPYDFIKLTPSHLPFLEELVNTGVCTNGFASRLVIGGEALRSDQIAFLSEKDIDIEIINEYGPTETTVGSNVFSFLTGSDIASKVSIPVGKAIDNVQVYILNSWNNLNPIGVPGEICVSGDGVARGYLNLPELTSEKFVPNPFGEGRMYRTGDLGRWLPDGNIEYLGRIDDQVKIRGYRIELGEIESILQQSGFLKQSVVTVKTDSNSNNKRLIAYIIAEKHYSEILLKKYLNSILPEYMVPDFFVELNEIPLTTNGKIDLSALPLVDLNILAEQSHNSPENAVEKILVDIWQGVLDLENVNVDDNFFNIGGNSLLAISLVNQINKRLGTSISINLIFSLFTIRDLANKIHKLNNWGSYFEPEYKTLQRPTKVEIAKIGKQTDLKKMFFLAPLGGIFPATSIVGILDMAVSLEQTLMFYSIQAPALNPEIKDKIENNEELLATDFIFKHSRLEQIVDEAVQEMLKIENEGPYSLGGFCSGCVIAKQIAEKLILMGKEVDNLILIDPPVWVEKVKVEDIRSTFSKEEVAQFIVKDLGANSPIADLEELSQRVQKTSTEDLWIICNEYVEEIGLFSSKVTPDELKQAFYNKFYNTIVLGSFFAHIKYKYPLLKIKNTLKLLTEDFLKNRSLQDFNEEKIMGNVTLKAIPASHRSLFLKESLPKWIDIVSGHIN